MKVLLLSHVADADGVTPVILTDLAFNDYDFQLFEVNEIDPFVEQAIINHFFDQYDQIFITDLCVSEKNAQLISKLPLHDKLIVLDHHIANLSLNNYSFINVIDSQDNHKESGTSLYYQYLLLHYPNTFLKKKSVAEMVDLVRLADTWEWKKDGVTMACDLMTIFAYYGNEKFIDNYKSFLRENDHFYFTDNERLLIDIDNKRKNDYIMEQKDKIMIREIDGYQVGIVFAEAYRSILGNSLAEIYQDQIDLVMIIDLNRGRISFRSTDGKADVNLFAQKFHGKGHAHAAGASLPCDIKDHIVEYIIKKR